MERDLNHQPLGYWTSRSTSWVTVAQSPKYHVLCILWLTVGFLCTPMKLIHYLWKAGSHIHRSCLLKETRRHERWYQTLQLTKNTDFIQSKPAAPLTSNSIWVLAWHLNIEENAKREFMCGVELFPQSFIKRLRAPFLEVLIVRTRVSQWSFHRCWEGLREAHDFHTLQQQGPINLRRACMPLSPRAPLRFVFPSP